MTPAHCETCRGRGWTEGPTEWPIECVHCRGRGGFESVAHLASRLGLKPRQLRSVWELRARQPLCLLVLERVAESFPRELGADTNLCLFAEEA